MGGGDQQGYWPQGRLEDEIHTQIMKEEIRARQRELRGSEEAFWGNGTVLDCILVKRLSLTLKVDALLYVNYSSIG